ncbi:MAG: hypothetical protein JWL85_426, partial [Candidatus Saccharibacteria bacterium]|nr:hypothetical protein [Candidatus Saccharibacteria bacterium]
MRLHIHFVHSSPRIAGWLTRVSGFIALLSVPIRELPERIESILPFEPDRLSHAVAIIIGLVLIYIGGKLAQRKKHAYYIASLSLIVLIAAELLYFRNILQVVFYGLALVALIASRKEFTVKSDTVSLQRGLMLSAGILGAALLFGAVTFSFIDQRDFGREYSNTQTLNFTLRWLVGLPNPDLTPLLTRQDTGIINSLRLAAITSLALAFSSLFRPIRFRFAHNQQDRERAKELIRTYSDSSEDFFKLWPLD